MIKIKCDNCKNSIPESSSVFCWTCYKKEAEKLKMKEKINKQDLYVEFLSNELHNLQSFLINEHIGMYREYREIKK